MGDGISSIHSSLGPWVFRGTVTNASGLNGPSGPSGPTGPSGPGGPSGPSGPQSGKWMW